MKRFIAFIAAVAPIAAGALIIGILIMGIARPFEAEGLGKDDQGVVSDAVVNSPTPEPVAASPLPPSGFAPQTRLGYTAGDQWEPAIATDKLGNVYMLYPQYGGVPGCRQCASPTMVLQISRDGGATWGAPQPIGGSRDGQWDAQMEVDPVDGTTVYAAWLQAQRSAIAVARSTDSGNTWSVVVPPNARDETDKPILAVRGQDVYVAFDVRNEQRLSASHDGGLTFTTATVANKKTTWALAGGGVVAPNGDVFFGWAGYAFGWAESAVNLFITRSTDGGQTWTILPIARSSAAPACPPDYGCGWAFLGAQMAMAADDGGAVYALWNAGQARKGPQRIYFSRSDDSGDTWSAPADVSTAADGVEHAFPAIVAGAANDVHIAWMDSRAGDWWNTHFRASTDGGQTWTGEVDLSTYVPGYQYIQPDGFRFPFGDYFEMSIDAGGLTHAVWGEGHNYDSPGSIWYSRGNAP
ncbi:MAG: exo-alpha-sialidase [Chloroflexi bacterium]|nr:exo-alpha-sialidase [Chloroflexota bacterium]